jgi:hypothetical protein
LSADEPARAELWDLYCQALIAKAELPPTSPAYTNALLNIRRIRVFMARRSLTPN